MKVIIDIPQEFGKHFNEDRFKDSLERIQIDTKTEVYQDNSASGNYELELLDILIEAFKNAEVREEVVSPKSEIVHAFGYYGHE